MTDSNLGPVPGRRGWTLKGEGAPVFDEVPERFVSPGQSGNTHRDPPLHSVSQVFSNLERPLEFSNVTQHVVGRASVGVPRAWRKDGGKSVTELLPWIGVCAWGLCLTI